MTKSEHSPEPWFVEPYCDSDRAEIHSGERTTDDEEYSDGYQYVTSPVVLAYKVLPLQADAERIVACVNALRGLNPEHVGELVAALDDLADYAEGACDEGFGSAQEQSDGMQASIKKARELLAKVKG